MNRNFFLFETSRPFRGGKDLSDLKGLPQAGASTIVELYEVKIDSEGTSRKKIDFK